MPRWPWIKLASDLHDNPRILLAGHDARNVFVFLLCMNGLHGGDGIIHRRWCDARFIALKVGLSATSVTRALKELVTQDLIAMTEDGSISLLGWDEQWRPQQTTQAERQRKYRQRLKSRDITLHNVTSPLHNVTSRHVDLRSENREREEDQIRTRTSGPSDPGGFELAEGTGVRSQSAPAAAEARKVLSEALGYLNRLTKRNFEVTDSRVTAVKRILGEGRRLDDIRVVFWSKAKGPNAWFGDERMDKHLNPDTLLRKAHFQKYLEQARLELAESKPERAKELGYIDNSHPNRSEPSPTPLVMDLSLALQGKS